MTEADPRREYVRNAIVDALGAPSERVCVLTDQALLALSATQDGRQVIPCFLNGSKALSAQEWLLQATHRSEPAIDAFLEDAAVDLLACSISTAPSGQRQLCLSNVADFSNFCEYQVDS